MKNGHFNKSPAILFFIVIVGALLRFPFLDRFPPALYSDEISQGYNAYSILKTGHDEYGTYFPVSFRSFGDWKPPLPTYLMVPSIALFGLNAWGVRLPSAIFGTFSILVTYFIVLELFQIKKFDSLKLDRRKLALLSAALLCISPWHIQQSRAAMLIIIELFFLELSVWSFLKGLRHPRWWYVSAVAWILGIYSYYGMRLIVPLFLVYLCFEFRGHLHSYVRSSVGPVLVAIGLLLPLGLGFINNPNVVFGRAKTVSIFYDANIRLTVWELIAQDGMNMPSKIVQFFHNKPYLYTSDIVRRFFQHFDGRFLFLIGDKHPPFQIPGMGILYLVDGIFIVAGIIYFLRNHQTWLRFLLVWIVISVLPAALTFLTPSANRTFTMVVPLMILTATGIVYSGHLFRRYLLPFTLVIGSMYVVSFGYFFHQNFVTLPRNHADMWHFGYPKLYDYLKQFETSPETISISGKASVPYIFYLFYRAVDPATVPITIVRNLKDDEFGFEHVSAFGKYEFPREYSWEKYGERLRSNSILVLTPAEKVGTGANLIQTIRYPDGRAAFSIYRIE